jgi:hypothetical protein
VSSTVVEEDEVNELLLYDQTIVCNNLMVF